MGELTQAVVPVIDVDSAAAELEKLGYNTFDGEESRYLSPDERADAIMHYQDGHRFCVTVIPEMCRMAGMTDKKGPDTTCWRMGMGFFSRKVAVDGKPVGEHVEALHIFDELWDAFDKGAHEAMDEWQW